MADSPRQQSLPVTLPGAATSPGEGLPGLPSELRTDVEAALTEALLAERERSSFLSEASRALAGSLNLSRTIARTLHLLVPRFTDDARVVLVTGRSARVSLLRADGESHGLDPVVLPSIPSDVEHVLRSGRHLRAGTALHLPLVARGTAFGTVTLRTAPEDEGALAVLEELVGRAALALDAARLYGERSSVASVLQASLRPPRLPAVPGVRLAARYRAALEHSELGGDFYDVHGAGDDWTVVVGDVCGKGVEAAVLTGQSRQSVRTAGLVDRDPARVLALLNDVLVGSEIDPGKFVTAVAARLRPLAAGGLRVDLASAGHPFPLHLGPGGVRAVPVTGIVAGAFPGAAYDRQTLVLAPGETLLLLTDGVLEARGRDGDFGEERLQRLLDQLARRPGGRHPDAVVDTVLEGVLTHLDGRPHDDIALLALQAGDGA
ncbi:serine phosphatase [Motilibacter rhizosphaerae]|uniref:Serine phosphatase n=1 Tax=Motilibacter rhizosphaerae TaxID=598652 RepID=A0A4Q7NHM7_9ACTN|nr:PP2C family protein-serine/threonine phosphatase [Motilibacter rhizosphaerae]RZS82956.1 serine phosphatase [Motilibacter rhizosphaerae]